MPPPFLVTLVVSVLFFSLEFSLYLVFSPCPTSLPRSLLIDRPEVYQDAFGEDENKCYMAVFDGHHGRFAADVSASELHHMLLSEMKKFDPKTVSTVALNMVESHEDTYLPCGFSTDRLHLSRTQQHIHNQGYNSTIRH
jgi:hypothetical protein